VLKWLRMDSMTRSCDYRNEMFCSLRNREHFEQLSGYHSLNRGSAVLDNIKVQVASATIINTLTQFSIYLFIYLEALVNRGQLQWQHRYLNTSETLQNKNKNRRE